MGIFEKFNSMYDVKNLAQEIEELKGNGDQKREIKQVPYGEYEVQLKKIELKEYGNGEKLKLAIQFQVAKGEYKNGYIFADFPLTTGNPKFSIKKANDFIDRLGTGLDIHFENFEQYAEIVQHVGVRMNGVKVRLEYLENTRGYKEYIVL